MTVLAAAINRNAGIAALASDQSTTNDGSVQYKKSKIRRLGYALVGVAGDPVGASFLFGYEPLDDIAAAEEWVHSLANRWRAWARENGWAAQYSFPWGALVVAPTGIWMISTSIAISEIATDYAAHGSGNTAALGAMWLLHSYYRIANPTELVTRGVQAAVAHAEGCGGVPFIETVTRPTP